MLSFGLSRRRVSITGLLRKMQQGDRGARREVFETSYSDLRQIARHLMRNERPGHTLGATGLLHEAFVGPLQKISIAIQDRGHFYAIAAIQMRRLLIDHGRRRGALKRNASPVKTDSPPMTAPADPLVLDLIRAVDRLRKHDPNAALIVEMKHLLGMTLEEIAAETGRPYRTVRDDWDFARGWLGQRLSK
jgi:RNA polymerase sigma-70 factor (ECF subfamily)